MTINKNSIIFALVLLLIGLMSYTFYLEIKIERGNEQAVVEYGELYNKFKNVSENFNNLFEFVNDKRYNNGRGVLAIYDIEYRYMPIWQAAQNTLLRFQYIQHNQDNKQ